MAKKTYQKDLYAIIGVSEQASEKEIVTGYRKKALQCHPDKNPDNPKAVEIFHELSNALEILTDPAARAAYDQTRKAIRAAEARNQELDSKTKKFKADLEARERAAFEKKQTEKKLKSEIQRLRQEGSRLLAEEQERLKEELKRATFQKDDHNLAGSSAAVTEAPIIKLKWKAQKNDPSNGGYNKDNLFSILGCYGNIDTLVLSSRRNGSAIVEFESTGVSSDINEESGLKDNPFSIVWLSGKPSDHQKFSNIGHDINITSSAFASPTDMGNGSSGIKLDRIQNISQSSKGTERDFESLVLMRMRQAEERKRLTEQMMKEDEDV